MISSEYLYQMDIGTAVLSKLTPLWHHTYHALPEFTVIQDNIPRPTCTVQLKTPEES